MLICNSLLPPQDERKANEGIMQALDRERQAALAAQQRAMEQHLAELDAERRHQADLAAQLSQTQVLSAAILLQTSRRPCVAYLPASWGLQGCLDRHSTAHEARLWSSCSC